MEHHLKIDRAVAALIIVIIGIDNTDSMTPGNDLIHEIKEFFPFGFTPAVGIINVTK